MRWWDRKGCKRRKLGLSVQSKGYNIFMVGSPEAEGPLRLQELTRCGNDASTRRLVYVYNFDEPGTPLAIRFAAKGTCKGCRECCNLSPSWQRHLTTMNLKTTKPNWSNHSWKRSTSIWKSSAMGGREVLL